MEDTQELTRCSWCGTDPLYTKYHDEQWGRPIHDDRTLFEMINLEGAQAGLSWITILRKRENYLAAFDNFDAHKIVQYDESKIAELLQNSGIVRNKLKINAVVKNSRAFLNIQEEFGSFDSWIWQFVNGETIVNRWESSAEVPAETEESAMMSKALKKRGFSFVGPTICYAYMQSCGMVNDHLISCHFYDKM
ncbi:MAG: DNA-3-methyladenine glycosylase I [Anaerolineae bacterium]